MAARLITSQHLSDVTVIEADGEGTALMEMWHDADFVILIDAVRSGTAPGTIHRFDAKSRPLSSIFFNYSTHTSGIVEAVELARTLDRLPSRLLVYGIEGKEFAAGLGLSPEVERAVKSVVGEIMAKVAK